MNKAQEKDSDTGPITADVPCPHCGVHTVVSVYSGATYRCPNCRGLVTMYLSSFRPTNGTQTTESPFAEITITPSEGAFDAGKKEPTSEPRTPDEA